MTKTELKWQKILDEEGLGMGVGSMGESAQRDAIQEYLETTPLQADPFLETYLDATVLKVINADPTNNVNAFSRLRKFMDGADTYVAGGHATRGAATTSHADRLARTPEWVNDNSKVQKVLLTAFPKLLTSRGHRTKAARWARIIQLYYRMGLPTARVAEILGIKVNSLIQILFRINTAAKRNITSPL